MEKGCIRHTRVERPKTAYSTPKTGTFGARSSELMKRYEDGVHRISPFFFAAFHEFVATCTKLFFGSLAFALA